MRSAALAFLAGIVLVQQLPVLPSLWCSVLLVPAAILAWRWPPALVVLAYVAGIIWISLRAGLILEHQLPQDLEGRDLIVEGFIADIPQATDYGYRFAFDVVGAWRDGTAVTVPARIRLSSRGTATPLRAGEAWRLEVRLRRPHGFQNPGGFDYESHLFRQRIRATGYVRAQIGPADGAHAGPVARLGYAINGMRERLGERMRSALGNHPFAGVVVALANGDSRGISHAQWDTLRRTGTLHLVAISGLHISLVAALAFLAARWLWALPGVSVLWVPAPIVGAAAALLAACLYAALAGFVIPTQRALIMLAVAMAAVFARRQVAPTRLLAAALVAVLVHDPLAVMALGFWLSFAAVAVIVFVTNDHVIAARWWRKWGHLQWGIAVGMAPLMLWLLRQLSLAAPVANMIAVPLFDLVLVPLTLAGVALLGLAPSLADWSFQTAATLLSLLWDVLEPLGAYRHALWYRPQPPLWAVLTGFVGAAVLLAPRGWPARWIGGVWLLPLFVLHAPAPAQGEVWLTLLDVGQGLSAVVRTENHTLVYDAGPRFSDDFDTGDAVVVPYLRERGVAHVDMLIVSHGDNDHAGGARSVVDAFAIPTVKSSVPQLPLAATPCQAGDRWDWDGVQFEVLNPDHARAPAPIAQAAQSQLAATARARHRANHDERTGGRRRTSDSPAKRESEARKGARQNNDSCVLLIRSRHGRILLPGDIEARAEQRLLRRFAGALTADVLIAPHHGSKTSSTAEFIDAVRPQVVLFPVGYRNRYHHPHPDVVARYRRRGVRLLDSAASGAIELYLSDRGYEVQRYREHARRYWFNVTPSLMAR